MQSKANTVNEYLADLPVERREALQAIREVILKNLPNGYEEGMQYGMIGYYVPHSVYPPGYHCDPKQPLPFGGLASQKNHMSMYLMCVYGDPEEQAWFRDAWTKAGKKLDMGKSCVRFKSIDDVPLNVVGEAFRRVPPRKFIEFYESSVKTAGKRPTPSRSAKKTTRKTAGKTTKKQTAKAKTKAKARTRSKKAAK
jgi:hypothetical protein